MGRTSKAAKERQQRRKGGTKRTRPDKGKNPTPNPNAEEATARYVAGEPVKAIVGEAPGYSARIKKLVAASGHEWPMVVKQRQAVYGAQKKEKVKQKASK